MDRQYSGPRGGVNDRTASIRQHDVNLVLHAQIDALQVDREHAVPEVFVDIFELVHGLLDAGVIESAVEPSKSRNGFIQSRFDTLAARHIAGDGEDPTTKRFDECGGFL
ncbi:hypothetical protein D9M68_814770 [compost metagenome]